MVFTAIVKKTDKARIEVMFVLQMLVCKNVGLVDLLEPGPHFSTLIIHRNAIVSVKNCEITRGSRVLFSGKKNGRIKR